jgi:hypothetical protein
VTDTRIVNNVVASWPGTGLIVSDTSRTTIVNNTIVPVDPGDTGSVKASLLVSGPNAGLVMRNNVMTRLVVESGAAPAVEDHNCVRHGGRGPHDVGGDPRFAETSQLRLSSASPCLGIGTLTDAPSVDRAGRPRGSRPDAGAWQLATASGATADTPVPDSGAGGPGYWMADSGGTVYAFGSAQAFGSGSAGTIDIEPAPGGSGYWLLAEDGTVVNQGGSRYFGAAGPLVHGERATSLSATPTGLGYWVFTSRGRVFAFGDAQHLGDMSATPLAGAVIDSVSTPSGQGYYFVGEDGGVFCFGDAQFRGSMGAVALTLPVRAITADPDGGGYLLVAADGGVFAFDADFLGSMGATPLSRPVSGIVASPGGYLMVAEDGGIFAFGSIPFLGSLGGSPPPDPVTSVASSVGNGGR